MAGIAFVHKLNEQADPCSSYRIKRILRAIKSRTTFKPKRLPLRYSLLQRLIDEARSRTGVKITIMLPAILLLTYHGCFRIGEVVKSKDLSHTLHLNNLKIINTSSGRQLRITLPSFKLSQEPATLTVQQTHDLYCPVSQFLLYLEHRGSTPGPLFLMPGGKPANRDFVAKHIKELLKVIGRDPTLYDTHSLRIGRASDLAAKGTPDHIIRHTGRWSSEAYLRYIRFADFKTPAP